MLGLDHRVTCAAMPCMVARRTRPTGLA